MAHLKADRIDAAAVKKEAPHRVEIAFENDTVKEELSQNPGLSAKAQWRKLWTAMKTDRQSCWWTLYTMLLVFGWGYDAGLSGVAIAFPEFRKLYGNYYADGQ
ncbi:hypothetical protein BDW59DRAFT_165615 [Aspergillus cavernicola]|uniref:Major facilitator superfamily (MFS) profile domain-containing protein n=1 Tax=Aspergillus cavernicola TaxID=176166 RepID=A0ABR4HRQ4_9EURO